MKPFQLLSISLALLLGFPAGAATRPMKLVAASLAAQDTTGPNASTPTSQTAPPPKHHHKLLGAVMLVGGAALVGLGAFAFSQNCPAQQRAQQISQQIGQTVTAGNCGTSWLQNNKTAVGAGSVGAGGALAIGGIVLLGK